VFHRQSPPSCFFVLVVDLPRSPPPWPHQRPPVAAFRFRRPLSPGLARDKPPPPGICEPGRGRVFFFFFYCRHRAKQEALPALFWFALFIPIVLVCEAKRPDGFTGTVPRSSPVALFAFPLGRGGNIRAERAGSERWFFVCGRLLFSPSMIGARGSPTDSIFATSVEPGGPCGRLGGAKPGTGVSNTVSAANLAGQAAEPVSFDAEGIPRASDTAIFFPGDRQGGRRAGTPGPAGFSPSQCRGSTTGLPPAVLHQIADHLTKIQGGLVLVASKPAAPSERNRSCPRGCMQADLGVQRAGLRQRLTVVSRPPMEC